MHTPPATTGVETDNLLSDDEWDLIDADDTVDVAPTFPAPRTRPVRRAYRVCKTYGAVVVGGHGRLHQGDNIRKYIKRIQYKRVRIQRTYKRVTQVAKEAPKNVLFYAWKAVQTIGFLSLGVALLSIEAARGSSTDRGRHSSHHDHHSHHSRYQHRHLHNRVIAAERPQESRPCVPEPVRIRANISRQDQSQDAKEDTNSVNDPAENSTFDG